MFMLMISMFISIMFLFMNHPITMGLTLLIQTIIISLISGMIHFNYWFSYILFLIMVGGLLVLFIYMTSIASNEMFYFSSKTMIMLFLIMFFMMIFFMVMDSYFMNFTFLFNENMNFLIQNMNFLKKFFNYPSIIIILIMMNYLFITLIATVKITKIEFGPLRQKF
uniref:NADH-ubiquinone oxidoreductase chain 6 n=1 Tax=Aleochara postica TaxID=2822418 RepID=A0A8A5RAH1_9COLE|nr:NADH dehydrogenase subunit 6 [Aleochara postica]QTG39870.1 NADH dehydrogenase subunit 6 [Aleochara postica]